LGATRAAHAAYYAGLAEQARLPLLHGEQAGWLTRLAREHDNLRAALGWFIECGDAEAAIAIGWDVAHFWVARGHLREGQRWMERALARGVVLGARARGRASYVLAHIAHGLGRVDDAAARYVEAIALARVVDDRELLAFALSAYGFTAAVRRDFEPAEAALVESEVAFAALGYDWALGGVWQGLALIALGRGEIDRALALLDAGATRLREAGAWWHLIVSLNIQIQLALTRADHVRAAALCREGVAAAGRIGDTTAIIYCLVGLAGAFALAGQPERAARFFGVAEALRERTGIAIEVPERRAMYDEHLALARSALGAAAFDAAWAAGRALAPSEAMAEALGGAP
ncbi:MAG TPA: hypothetical protein VIL85_10070, partial [Thermomicrobiales bacterium]